MNIWIDLDNSPHVLFFAPVIRELKRRGYTVTLTARDAFQAIQLADLFGLEYKRVGHHYGKHAALKVYGLCVRALELLPTTLTQKIDLAVSHGSRAQLLAARLRGIRSLVIFDYEFASHLFVKPAWIMVPEVIPSEALSRSSARVLRYPGIKEDVYVPDFVPDPSIRARLGINGEHTVVTLRPPADEAHYRNPESDTLFHAAMEYLGTEPRIKVVLLPRNERQAEAIRRQWKEMFSAGKVICPERAVDGINLIWHSDLVISGGGTMNREAAALGVPVYSIFRGKIGAVDRYLSEKRRLVLIETTREVREKICLVRRQIPPKPVLNGNRPLNVVVNHIIQVCGQG